MWPGPTCEHCGSASIKHNAQRGDRRVGWGPTRSSRGPYLEALCFRSVEPEAWATWARPPPGFAYENSITPTMIVRSPVSITAWRDWSSV